MSARHVALAVCAVSGVMACVSASRAEQVATGDFNGDGRADLAIGVPSESVNGNLRAGLVHIIYGSGNGLRAQGDEILHEDRPGVADSADLNDYFGFALAAGDIDDDGFDDLAVGVPGEVSNGQQDGGQVHLFFGSSGGLAGGPDRLFRNNFDSVDEETDDIFGAAVAIGDFDDDGFDELVVGVPGGDTNNTDEDAGFIVVFSRDSAGGNFDEELFEQGSNGVLGPFGEEFAFGSAFAVGDFDNDGHDDLAVGASGTVVDGYAYAGAVAVLYGSNNGLSRAGDQSWNQNTEGVRNGANSGDRFGLSLAAGDFDGDGRDDLAIGVPGETVDGGDQAGAVEVLYGTNAGLTAAGDQLWHQGSPGVAGNPSMSDFFGFSVAAGDFDGDGRDDLAIGVRLEDVAGQQSAGAVAVLYGSGGGLDAAGDQLWHQDRPGIANAAEVEEAFGNGVAAGDFDDDGRDDLVVTVPYEDFSGNTDAGVVHVIYGAGNGLKSAGDQLWHQDVSGIGDSAEDFDRFGGTVGKG